MKGRGSRSRVRTRVTQDTEEQGTTRGRRQEGGVGGYGRRRT